MYEIDQICELRRKCREIPYFFDKILGWKFQANPVPKIPGSQDLSKSRPNNSGIENSWSHWGLVGGTPQFFEKKFHKKQVFLAQKLFKIIYYTNTIFRPFGWKFFPDKICRLSLRGRGGGGSLKFANFLAKNSVKEEWGPGTPSAEKTHWKSIFQPPFNPW